MTEAEQLVALQKVSDTAEKNRLEVVGVLASLATSVAALLEAQAKAGNSTPAVDAAVADVQAKLDATDALIPDAPVVPPAPLA